MSFVFVVVQLLSHVWLRRYWLQHARLLCSPLSPRVCSDSYPLNRCCSCLCLLCLQSFPASGSFPVSQLFTSCGQSIGALASASVLPMNIQGWFHLELTSFISLWFKDPQESSPVPQLKKQHSAFFMVQLSPVHDYWKNHNFDYMHFCWQSDVSAF